MYKLIISLSALLVLSSCGVNPDEAIRILKSQGIKNPVIGSYTFFGCAKDDSFHSTWNGNDVNGNPISGVICGGPLKGYTVRFN